MSLLWDESRRSDCRLFNSQQKLLLNEDKLGLRRTSLPLRRGQMFPGERKLEQRAGAAAFSRWDTIL